MDSNLTGQEPLQPISDGNRKPDGTFAPGNTLSPGRKLGSKNRATLMAQSILEQEAATLARKALDLALGGDSQALKLCLERLIPVRKSRAVELELPPINNASDVNEAMSQVILAIADGALTIDEGLNISNVLDAKRKSLETLQLEERISELEARANEKY